jgi:PKD repeat protein
MGHGMDWNRDNNTMYVATYNSLSFISSIRTIDLVTGITAEVTLVPTWTGIYANSIVFEVDFSSDITTVCAGNSVNFVDESVGASSWQWTFEGGTPATSTEQNPTVVYNTPGDYDVKLVASGSANTDSVIKVDYINVIETPAQCDMPEGDTSVCTDGFYNYSTNVVNYATDYEWELTPAEAGTLDPNMNNATFEVSSSYNGSFAIKVRATNSCGDGDWSDELEGNVYQTMEMYDLEGGGDYCEGGTGVEITQNGSEDGVDYELYLDGNPTGNVVAGTGSAISFGLVTEPGSYESYGDNGHCVIAMNGLVTVGLLYPPGQAAEPAGPTVVCNSDTSDYTSTGAENANSYVWELDPADAGTITGDSLNATVIWNSTFSGTAYVSLYGVNDCGNGVSSDALEVNVESAPEPEITGASVVCDYQDGDYSVDDFEGATYTWETTGGGTITAGQGTNSITVTWGMAGNGTVSVTVESANGCVGVSDAFDVLIDDCTGIGDHPSDATIAVHPNPARDHVVIEADVTIEHVTVLDFLGKQLYSSDENSKSVKIDISGFPAGTYFVRVVSENSIATKRLIKK